MTLESADHSLRRNAAASAGGVRFDDVPTGAYQLSIEATGFARLTTNFTTAASGDNSIDATLTPVSTHNDSVTVQGAMETPLEEGPSAPVALSRDEVRNTPAHPATVKDSLSLTPGIVQLPDGKLSLSGTGEHRSALLVNSYDATDPATGEFGATIPIDSVETIRVLSSPFLAEYGGFSSSVVSVETRKAGEKWHFELNDPLPEFRWRSWHMVGLRSLTPRISFGGPWSTTASICSNRCSTSTAPIPSSRCLSPITSSAAKRTIRSPSSTTPSARPTS